jgi:thymidylate synthase
MPENEYLAAVANIIENGDLQATRNGKTYSLFGVSMRFSLADNVIPLLTTKKVAWKTCLKELLWFISGKTDNRILQKQNVHIWDQNASRAFLDSQNLTHLEEGDLGPIYGHQWRHYNACYKDCHTDYTDKGVDQLSEVISCLKDPKRRSSRRIILCAWNPCQIGEMALPPCHILSQFYVSSSGELSCTLYQRSGDMGLGVPFNIASYSFLTHLLAVHCGLVAKEFIHFIGNAHVYKEHVEPLKQQLARRVLDPPRIRIGATHESIDEYSVDDFTVEQYSHAGSLKMRMKA